MSTKSQRFRAAILIARSTKNAPERHVEGRKSKPVAKAHNLSQRAGRTARVAYESSVGRPSRLSTRGSAHHQRAANQLERTQQLSRSTPETRAVVSMAQSSKVRGKP